MFQSRNRETFDSNVLPAASSNSRFMSFNLVIEKLLIPTHRLPTFALQSLRGFNLVIEKLLIPTCWTDHIHGAQDYRFQSRNRETFDSNSERMNIASVTAKYQVSIS